jgi:CRP/FNR family transcriptional regulator, cyclic AMP receptor protein
MSMNQPRGLGVGRHDSAKAVGSAEERFAAILGTTTLFDGLSVGAYRIASRCSLVRSPRKRLLYSQGAPASAVYVVVSGRVRVLRASSSRVLTVGYRCPGDLVGETGVFGSQQYQDSAIATEAVEAVEIPNEALRDLMLEDPVVNERLLRIMVDRRVEAERRVEELLVQSVESRVAGFLADAAQRHGIPDSRGVLVGVKYTHQEIGDYVGSTRETVTLTLGEFKRRGWIDFDHRRVVVLDRGGLLSAAS